MSVIKDHYSKTGLSLEKKAELKRALKESFPQYDRPDIGRTEVVIMENERITDTGGRAMVRSKLKTGMTAAIAAALLVTVGISAVKHMEFGVSPAGEQTGYIDNKDSEYYEQAKTIYNCMYEILAEYEVNGYFNEIRDIADRNEVITRDMIIAARSAGEYQEFTGGVLGLASRLDDSLKIKGIDAGSIEFKVDFEGDNVIDFFQMRVYVYPDESHEAFYCYPEPGEENFDEDGNGDYSHSSDAKTLYNMVCEVVADFDSLGYTLDIENNTITRETVLAARNTTIEHKDGEPVGALEFAAAFDESLKTWQNMDAADIDFEVAFNENQDTEDIFARVKYVFIYKDESHETFSSYPKYIDYTDTAYIETDLDKQARAVYKALDLAITEYRDMGCVIKDEHSVISSKTVLEARNTDISHEEGVANALELAARIDELTPWEGCDAGDIDFEAVIDTETMSIEYVIVFENESHSLGCIYPKDDISEPEQIHLPAGMEPSGTDY